MTVRTQATLSVATHRTDRPLALPGQRRPSPPESSVVTDPQSSRSSSETIEGLARRARIPLRPADNSVNGDSGDNGQAEAARIAGLADDLGLTRREVEVLGELAAGRTDREIGELLYISRKTASVHVSNLLRKLNVANRVEAGGIGQAHGLG